MKKARFKRFYLRLNVYYIYDSELTTVDAGDSCRIVAREAARSVYRWV